MKTKVKTIIKKHYGKNARFKTRGWEQCGVEIYSFIREEEDKIRSKNLTYSEECRAIDARRNSIENEYESYFSFTNMSGQVAGYDWVNGNKKLQKLINPSQ